jgi:hypothetical protein
VSSVARSCLAREVCAHVTRLCIPRGHTLHPLEAPGRPRRARARISPPAAARARHGARRRLRAAAAQQHARHPTPAWRAGSSLSWRVPPRAGRGPRARRRNTRAALTPQRAQLAVWRKATARPESAAAWVTWAHNAKEVDSAMSLWCARTPRRLSPRSGMLACGLGRGARRRRCAGGRVASPARARTPTAACAHASGACAHASGGRQRPRRARARRRCAACASAGMDAHAHARGLRRFRPVLHHARCEVLRMRRLRTHSPSLSRYPSQSRARQYTRLPPAGTRPQKCSTAALMARPVCNRATWCAVNGGAGRVGNERGRPGAPPPPPLPARRRAGARMAASARRRGGERLQASRAAAGARRQRAPRAAAPAKVKRRSFFAYVLVQNAIMSSVSSPSKPPPPPPRSGLLLLLLRARLRRR